LTERLKKIASLVSQGSIIADIGTDHGYLPAYLLKKGIVKKAILSDVSKGSLEKGRTWMQKNNLTEKAEFRLGSGINILNENEVDEIIIAGMGGILISEILEGKKEILNSVKKIILQPMQNPEILRKYLYKNRYEFISEHLVKEDFRIYEIIVVRLKEENIIEEKTNEKEPNKSNILDKNIANENKILKNKNISKGIIEVDDIFYEIGKDLIDKKDLLLAEFIQKKIKNYEAILDNIKNISGEKIEIKRNDCIRKIKTMEEILENLKS
jgi:tRNA (adenine22-N1)-methyltransferase